MSRRFEAAAGMALATVFVLTLASGLSFLVWHWVLQPLGLEYLRTLAFILLIAGVVQFTELMVRATSPLLHQVLGIFLPLITTNCAVLGVALINVDKQHGLLESLVFGAERGGGLRPRAAAVSRRCANGSRRPTCPRRFAARRSRSITAGLMALAFMGFTGLAAR